GPPRLERRTGRALDADARPPRSPRRGAPARRVRSGPFVVADLARRSARGADPGEARPRSRHVAQDQRLASRLASRHARLVHGLRLWLGSGPAVGPATRRRQRYRDARRRPRGVAAPRRRGDALGQDPSYLPGRAAAVRPSLRFLALAVVGWAGIRAASLGLLPGAELFRVERSEAKAPAIVPTQFPVVEPIEPA